MLNAIKEQQKIIEELKKKISETEQAKSKVTDELSRRLEALERLVKGAQTAQLEFAK
jgi:hypothetical protein